MNEPQNRLQSLWQEFVRRSVVRVAIFYGAIAWVVVQVADLFLEAFDAEFLLRYFVAAVLVGFPIALVLSWMFDITPQGIQRTPPVRSDAEAFRSIAVLPFANFSDDPGNEYFSDGLAEEIRDQLSKVPGLRVAARTSSFAFKGRNEDAREIGRRLDVGLILEGGVRKHDDTVRISVQLVDTRRGYQLWSATFERQLQDIFRVQSEISGSILEYVHLRVLDHGVMQQPTSDFEAYNLYLLGRHHFHKRTELALNRAVEYFTEARNRDPQFALAYSGLADALSLLSTGYYGNLPVAESIAKALPAAQRALAIAPDSAEAHASMGLIRDNQKDYDGAIASLQHAIKLRPTYTLAHVWLGVVLNSIGRYKEAAERDAEALRLDPLSPIINTNAGFDAIRFGNDKEAESRFRHAIELDPAFAVPYSGMARMKTMRGASCRSTRVGAAGARTCPEPCVLSRAQGIPVPAIEPARTRGRVAACSEGRPHLTASSSAMRNWRWPSLPMTGAACNKFQTMPRDTGSRSAGWQPGCWAMKNERYHFMTSVVRTTA